jgi:hypothetical protein
MSPVEVTPLTVMAGLPVKPLAFVAVVAFPLRAPAKVAAVTVCPGAETAPPKYAAPRLESVFTVKLDTEALEKAWFKNPTTVAPVRSNVAGTVKFENAAFELNTKFDEIIM